MYRRIWRRWHVHHSDRNQLQRSQDRHVVRHECQFLGDRPEIPLVLLPQREIGVGSVFVNGCCHSGHCCSVGHVRYSWIVVGLLMSWFSLVNGDRDRVFHYGVLYPSHVLHRERGVGSSCVGHHRRLIATTNA